MNPSQVYKRLGGDQFIPFSKPVRTDIDLADMVLKGIPKQTIRFLAGSIGVDERDIIQLLPVTPRNLQRYKDTDTLSDIVTDHLVGLASLFEWGEHVLGKDYFTEWLKKPSLPLRNTRPFDLLTSNTGIQVVKDELIRIAFGVLA